MHPNPAPDTRPTSLSLIAKALAAHRITRQAALVDQVWALLAPGRLPRSLVGSQPLPDLGDSGVFAAIADGWRTLSASQRAEILPYLGPYKFPAGHLAGRAGPAGLPPVECARTQRNYGGGGKTVAVPPFGSKVPPGWAFIGTTHFKIWYVTESIPFTSAAQSKATATYLAAEAEKVWDAETGLFGREPLSDAGQRCNGGDGRLDIYVLREFGPDGLTQSYVPYSCTDLTAQLEGTRPTTSSSTCLPITSTVTIIIRSTSADIAISTLDTTITYSCSSSPTSSTRR